MTAYRTLKWAVQRTGCLTVWCLTVWWLATGVLAGDSVVQRPFEQDTAIAPSGPLDRLVFAGWQRSGVQPARRCSDAVFLRRAYLDVIGVLPTGEEAARFLGNGSPRRRAELVDELLERAEYADYWAWRWSDRLRVKSEFPINLWPNAVQAYYHWIHARLTENTPYDEFARQLLVSSGSNFRDPQVNFYRANQGTTPEAIAQSVALTFMGVRTERWPAERVRDLSVFFSRVGYKKTDEWKEEIVLNDLTKAPVGGKPGQVISAVLPDGSRVEISNGVDPRRVFADWLITPENPWFARNAVNHIWYWVFGRGIVHEPDDIRPGNPPQNAELLSFLESELLRSHYDVKHVLRLILNSTTYQLSSIPRNGDAKASEACFAHYAARRLEAEVLIDALCQISGAEEEYSSPIPEPFTFIPKGERSVALADGSITSSFLDMFGRSARDTGFASERDNRPTAEQRLHMLNSSHVQKKIIGSQKLRAFTRGNRSPRLVANQIYLTILSRYPTPEELRTVQSYATSRSAKAQETLADVTWALVNSAEFQYRH